MRPIHSLPPAVLLPVFLGLVLGGCLDAPKKEAEKPAEPVSGSHALFQMYTSARAWAPDIQVLRMTSIHVPEVPPQPGKAAAWQVIFVSPSLGKSRSYTYSAVEASAVLRKGIFSETPQNWSDSGAKQFLIAAVKTDSDQAYETAMKQPAAAAYSKKDPKSTIMYTLERNDRFPDAAWRVIWGESAGTSGFSIFVDASTGQYLETLH